MNVKKINTKLFDKRDTFPFFIVSSNIYNAFIVPEILRFSRTTSHSNAFITLSNQPLEIMQKHTSKQTHHIHVEEILFGKHLNVFNVFGDTAYKSMKLFLLH